MEEARRTNSSTLNHVADRESFYRLILWCTPRAIGATDRLDMTPTLLIATAVMDMLVVGLWFCISAWEAYLDARFLTMIATCRQKGSKRENDSCLAMSMRRDTRVSRGLRVREAVIEIDTRLYSLLSNPTSQEWECFRLWLNLGVLALLSPTCRCLPIVECPDFIRQGGCIYRAQLIDPSLPCQLPVEPTEVRLVEEVRVEVRYLLLRTAPQTYLVPS